MKTERQECHNVDSCTPGTSHLYPIPGETVKPWCCTEVRIVGSKFTFEHLSDGEGVTVDRIFAEAHEVMVVLADGRKAWLAIDDLDWTNLDKGD